MQDVLLKVVLEVQEVEVLLRVLEQVEQRAQEILRQSVHHKEIQEEQGLIHLHQDFLEEAEELQL